MQRIETLLRHHAERWIGRAVVATLVLCLLVSAGTQSAWAQTATPGATRSTTYVVQVRGFLDQCRHPPGADRGRVAGRQPGFRACLDLAVGGRKAGHSRVCCANAAYRNADRTTPTAQPTPTHNQRQQHNRRAASAPTTAPTVAASGVLTHVVQAGESWNSIAQKYDVPVRQLQRANPDALRADEVLFRGVELVIPAADGSAAPTAQPAAQQPPHRRRRHLRPQPLNLLWPPLQQPQRTPRPQRRPPRHCLRAQRSFPPIQPCWRRWLHRRPIPPSWWISCATARRWTRMASLSATGPATARKILPWCWWTSPRMRRRRRPICCSSTAAVTVTSWPIGRARPVRCACWLPKISTPTARPTSSGWTLPVAPTPVSTR